MIYIKYTICNRNIVNGNFYLLFLLRLCTLRSMSRGDDFKMDFLRMALYFLVCSEKVTIWFVKSFKLAIAGHVIDWH